MQVKLINGDKLSCNCGNEDFIVVEGETGVFLDWDYTCKECGKHYTEMEMNYEN